MMHLLPAIAWTLIHFCWQAAAIAALYGAASLFLTRRSSSRTRYMLALAALIAMLVAAAGTFAWQFRADFTQAGTLLSSSNTHAALPNRVQQAMPPGLVRTATEMPASSGANPNIPALMPWIDGIWLLGVFALSLRSLGGWWIIRRLRASADPAIPDAVRASFDRIAAALGLRRNLDLAVSNSVSGPLTVGFLRATVLLPLSAITALGPEELEVVLAHELAHVRRADFLWNLVQTFAETVFFFHPAVWWIGSCLRSERELCCDDMALQVCPNPVVYASALFHLEEQRARQPHLAMALDGNGSGHSLRMRILRILGEPVMQISRGPSRAFSISVALAGLLLLVFPSTQVLASLHPAHAAVSTHPAPKLVVAPVLHVSAVTAVEPVVAVEAKPQPVASPEPAITVQESSEADKPHAGTPATSTSGTSYIDRMKAAGYDVDLDKYIAMKVQNITPDYARAMAQAGFGKLSADDLIACKIQGVTPEYMADLKKQGLDVANVHDAISFRIFQVTPEFISGMKAAGFTNIDSQKLIALRVQGVTPEYARSIAQRYPGASVDDIVKTKIFNIDADFIESAKKHGFNDLKLEKLVQLRISGLLDDESVKP